MRSNAAVRQSSNASADLAACAAQPRACTKKSLRMSVPAGRSEGTPTGSVFASRLCVAAGLAHGTSERCAVQEPCHNIPGFCVAAGMAQMRSAPRRSAHQDVLSSFAVMLPHWCQTRQAAPVCPCNTVHPRVHGRGPAMKHERQSAVGSRIRANIGLPQNHLCLNWSFQQPAQRH